MALLVALVAGLLVVAESQASDKADSSNPQGFLSQHLGFTSDASRIHLDHYDKFMALNHLHHANGPTALSHHQSLAEHGPGMDGIEYLDVQSGKVEDKAVQKLLANGNNSPITLSAIGVGLLALVTMLGVRIRRALQQGTVPASSGSFRPDMSINMAGLGDSIMEMQSQGSSSNISAACETRHPCRETSRRVGWGQLSSQNSRLLSLCYAQGPLQQLRTMGGEGTAAKQMRAYFAAWNVRDMETAVQLWAEDCKYEDTQYAGAFEGKEALRAHLIRVADALPESFAFIVDEVADGGSTVGVQWHVESNGEPLPFTRGCSVYTANADGLLATGFDVPEPAPIKPGGAGLALLSLASKIIAEPLRALPLLCFLIYCQQLFLAEGQLLPGPSALALDGATWIEVRDLSLNFWFVGPAAFGAAFPVVHPGLEAIFNLVLAWSALFAGFAADGRKGRPQGSMLPTLAGMQFLTNAFYLPYLGTRPNEEDEDITFNDLGPVEKACESRVLPLLLGGVGTVCVYWFAFARPEFGDLPTRMESLRQLLSGDRLGSSFIIDLGLYALFQSWLIPDDLKRRGVPGEQQGVLRAVGAVPFVGLVAYLLLRPKLREE